MKLRIYVMYANDWRKEDGVYTIYESDATPRKGDYLWIPKTIQADLVRRLKLLPTEDRDRTTRWDVVDIEDFIYVRWAGLDLETNEWVILLDRE